MNRSSLIRSLAPLGGYATARLLARRHPRILMYHRFDGGSGEGDLDAAIFRRQVRYIRRRHTPITLGALIDALARGTRPPSNAVVVTVDDGYDDFYHVAWPILREHGVPATLFATTGFVDGELWLWPDQISWLLDGETLAPVGFEVAGERLPDGLDTRGVWGWLIQRLLRVPDERKHEIIAELASSMGTTVPERAPPAYRSVSWEQLRAMHAEGLEVGGHTHSHPSLAMVAPERLPVELDACRERLDAELGAEPRPFCYPNGQPGDYSQQVREAVERAGFTGAVVAHSDHRGHDDRFVLRRHSSSGNMFQFYKAVSGLEWLGSRLDHWRRGA